MAEPVLILYQEGDTGREQLPHYLCLLEFSSIPYGKWFKDIVDRDGHSYILPEAFSWLMNIRRVIMFIEKIRAYVVEPYMPNRFTRQSRYNHLYVGNLNPELKFDELLLGEATTYYNITGHWCCLCPKIQTHAWLLEVVLSCIPNIRSRA